MLMAKLLLKQLRKCEFMKYSASINNISKYYASFATKKNGLEIKDELSDTNIFLDVFESRDSCCCKQCRLYPSLHRIPGNYHNYDIQILSTQIDEINPDRINIRYLYILSLKQHYIV